MHDDFDFEPIKGLPERPPKGEQVLWQGRPDALILARESLGLYWIVGYFAILAIWRIGVSSTEMPFGAAVATAIPFVMLGLVVCALIYGFCLLQARLTVYTITNMRVAMRIGAALTVTLNLPFVKIEKADLALHGGKGHGSIALRTNGSAKLSYLVLWPHIRPWHFNPTEPSLRAIPNAESVAQILTEAAQTRIDQPKISAASIGQTAPEGAL